MTLGPCQACGAPGRFGPCWPELRIERCGGCGLLTADVGAIDAERLYGAEYFAGGEYRDYEEDAAILLRNFRRMVRRLAALAPGPRLLELGSAYGYFLEAALPSFPEARGIEISPAAAAAARARGLPVEQGDVLRMERGADEPPHDVVCLWDTIEHLERPGDVILHVARWLRPGGLLALTTGDAGSFVARFRGRRWRLVHPPTHVHYFDRASLTALAARAGIDLVEWSHPTFSRSWASMAHNVLDRRGRAGRALASALTLGGRLDFPVTINLFDLCLFVGRKRAAT
jgi:SAM-dependent methyltransferase